MRLRFQGYSDILANISANSSVLTNNIDSLNTRTDDNTNRLATLDSVDENVVGSLLNTLKSAKSYTDTSIVTFTTDVHNVLKDRVDIIDGASTVEGSFRKTIADVIGNAPEALDTLAEIAVALNNDTNAVTALYAAIDTAKATIIGDATVDYNTLGKIEAKLASLDNAVNGSGGAIEVAINNLDTNLKAYVDAREVAAGTYPVVVAAGSGVTEVVTFNKAPIGGPAFGTVKFIIAQTGEFFDVEVIEDTGDTTGKTYILQDDEGSDSLIGATCKAYFVHLKN